MKLWNHNCKSAFGPPATISHVSSCITDHLAEFLLWGVWCFLTCFSLFQMCFILWKQHKQIISWVVWVLENVVGCSFFLFFWGIMQFTSGEERVADNCLSSPSEALFSLLMFHTQQVLGEVVLRNECPEAFFVSALVMARVVTPQLNTWKPRMFSH